MFIRALIAPWTRHPQARPFRQLLLAKGLVELFGEKDKYSRAALGAVALTLNVPVEINLIVEVEA
jgi:hypothetical protein